MVTTVSEKLASANLETNVEFDIDFIALKINEIIEEDRKLDKPVFLFIDSKVIYKLAEFLSGAINRPVAVGIAGETASGKSTFTQDIIKTITDFQKKYNLSPIISRINTDDYYYDRSEMVKTAGSFGKFAQNYDLDIPEAFELDLLKRHIEQLVLGNSVWLPKYDMSGTAIRYDNHTLSMPAPLIITEGLFTLTAKVKDAFDFCIYVSVSPSVQKSRFFKRAEERDLGSAAQDVYDNAVSKAEIYIKPSAANAEIIVNGEASREDYLNITNKFLGIIESIRLLSASVR